MGKKDTCSRRCIQDQYNAQVEYFAMYRRSFVVVIVVAVVVGGISLIVLPCISSLSFFDVFFFSAFFLRFLSAFLSACLSLFFWTEDERNAKK